MNYLDGVQEKTLGEISDWKDSFDQPIKSVRYYFGENQAEEYESNIPVIKTNLDDLNAETAINKSKDNMRIEGKNSSNDETTEGLFGDILI